MHHIPVPKEARGLIFDLDGTIIDSMPLHYEGYNHVLAPYGIHYPQDVFYSRGGIPTRDTMNMIAQNHQIKDFDIVSALEKKRLFVENNLGQLQLIDPVFSIIMSYHGKLPMAIGTGSNRRMVNQLLEIFPIGNYISQVVTSDDVTHFKPHPETFLKCASLIGVAPEHCVVFEDGKPGMQAAETAGMQVIDVTKYI